jgi:hypothetical protein
VPAQRCTLLLPQKNDDLESSCSSLVLKESCPGGFVPFFIQPIQSHWDDLEASTSRYTVAILCSHLLVDVILASGVIARLVQQLKRRKRSERQNLRYVKGKV